MTGRMRRVNESVRAVVADAVAGLQDPRIGIVTVTGVTVSADLQEAKVFVSVFGGEKRRLRSLAALESARGIVQGHLARELRMKRTPHLTFEYDPTGEYGVRMTRLIDELAPETLPDGAGEDSNAD
jgi:ribosome-binding factor A